MAMSSFDRGTPITRRALMGLAGAVGVTAALAACAGPGTTRAVSTGAAAFGGSKKGTVSFAHWRGEDKAVFDKLIASFQMKNPGTFVKQDISTSTDYQAQALQKLRGGGVGDVAPAFRGAQFESFVSAGLFTDLSTSGLGKYYEANLITAGASKGRQYGYPYELVFLDPLANMDILTSVGVTEAPTDWNAYIDMLDKIKSKGIVPMAFPGADAGNAGQLFNSMIMNVAPSDDMCAKIEAGVYKCTDPWFVQMLGYYKDLRPYVQPNSSGTAVEPAEELFATGKAALLATGSYHVASVRALGAAFPIDLAPAVTAAPGKAKYVGSYNSTFILGINSASKVDGADLAWLEFLSDPANAGIYANGTAQFSPVKGVQYSNPDLKRLQPWLVKKTLLAPRYQFNNLDMRNAVEASCTSVLNGADPTKAAEDVQKIVDQLVHAG